MTTLQYPDISHYQAGLDLHGAPAVMAKATQGVSYVDPNYRGFKAQASSLGIPFAAYHWLDTTDAAAQARHCYPIVGPGVPLMIDDEQGVISVPHTLAFVQEYRRLGGLVTREYAPRWLWQNSGQPDLRPLAAAGLGLVSSNYPFNGYSDNGPGWAPYGGVTPVAWQWSSKRPFNGHLVDFNAYRGDISGVFGGNPSPTPVPAAPPAPPVQEDDMLVFVWATGPNGNGLWASESGRRWHLSPGAADAYKATLHARNIPWLDAYCPAEQMDGFGEIVAAPPAVPLVLTDAQLAQVSGAANAGAKTGVGAALNGATFTTTVAPKA